MQWELVHRGDEVAAAAPGTRSVLRPRPAVDGQDERAESVSRVWSDGEDGPTWIPRETAAAGGRLSGQSRHETETAPIRAGRS